MKSNFNIAIVGATGMVGATILTIFEERSFPVDQLYLLASARSIGEKKFYKNKYYPVIALEDFDFSKTDICFFCVSNEIAAIYAPKATELGNVVIDKSSLFRYSDDVPLVVPEVNEHVLEQYRNKNIVASPNCTTIPLAVALKPIYDAVGISRINVATYQSVSGSGRKAVAELTEQTKQVLNGHEIHPTVYPQQIAFNVLPHIDLFESNGYTREEMKVVWELQKIFADPNIAINPTAVRVPVYCGHAAAVHLETNDKITTQQALRLLSEAKGVEVITGEFPYPTQVKNAVGKDNVYVGRIREDLSHPNGLNMWIVADNLRKGAALNAVQVAEKLVKDFL